MHPGCQIGISSVFQEQLWKNIKLEHSETVKGLSYLNMLCMNDTKETIYGTLKYLLQTLYIKVINLFLLTTLKNKKYCEVKF